MNVEQVGSLIRKMNLNSNNNSSCDSNSSISDPHDLLICDICLEAYNENNREAKFLACHHSFCIRCLNQMKTVSSNSIYRTQIECPTCRHVTFLPEHGIASLQTNFYITCIRDMFSTITPPVAPVGCLKHSNQPMSFFCRKCGISICRDCTILDHKSSEGHDLLDIAIAETEQQQILNKTIHEAKETASSFEKSLQSLEAELGNLSIVKDYVLKELDEVFDRCMKLLEFRKLQLGKSVFELYNQKKERLHSKGDEINSTLQEINYEIEKSENCLKKGVLADIVNSSEELKMAMQSIVVAEKLDLDKNYLSLDSETGIVALEENLCKFGAVVSNFVLPTKIEYNIEKLIACRKCIISFEVHSHHNESKIVDYQIVLEIRDSSDIIVKSDTKMPCNGLDGSSYQCKFRPSMSGQHKIRAIFLGQVMKGTEIIVMVESNNPTAKFGCQGNGYGKFFSPRAVAIDSEQCLYVADTGNRLIQRIDYNGEFLYQFSVNNKENSSTCDLALNEEEKLIYCTETFISTGYNPTTGNSVILYNMDGKVQDMYKNKVMKCALCIAKNSRGEIIVSDYLVHSLFMFNKNGTFLRRIGHAGHFNHPAFICIGKNEDIIVSDTNNDCIHVFDAEGNFKFQFGESGSGNGELRQPFGVATDGDHIFVVDSGNKRIQLYDMSGKYLSMIESHADPLLQPRGMCVTIDGFCYVADRDNHCIKKFKYS